MEPLFALAVVLGAGFFFLLAYRRRKSDEEEDNGDAATNPDVRSPPSP
jgi:hypothetical protein